MKEGSYRFIGWLIFICSLALAAYWCATRGGPMQYLLQFSEKVFKTDLIQISWILTFLLIAGPGYLIRNFFEGLAWNAHVRDLPPPDIQESARRSKYIKAEDVAAAAAAAPARKAVKLENLPEGQEEFVASCPACGQFFSATRGAKDLKCPHCGEAVPLET